MSVNIRAVSKVQRVASLDSKGLRAVNRENGLLIYVDPNTPGAVEALNGREEGIYSAGEEDLSFNIAYGNWSLWFKIFREILGITKRLWAYAELRGKPFGVFLMTHPEGINIIGPETSKNIAEEFRSNEEMIRQKLPEVLKKLSHQEQEEYWLARYELFKQAFIVASDEGFVELS